jgi:hydrogenase nickel incorporation protein HypA/HybF
MHELPVTEKILEVALKHAEGQNVNRTVRIHLRVSTLSDLEHEWIQRYFDYLSKGTLAEGARLQIESSPIVLRCRSCQRSFEISKQAMDGIKCPDCGETSCSLVSGREYYVKNMEVV